MKKLPLFMLRRILPAFFFTFVLIILHPGSSFAKSATEAATDSAENVASVGKPINLSYEPGFQAYAFKSVNYELGLISQTDLTYRGHPTLSACTAASIGMISEFWMDGDFTEGQLFAQSIIDINTDQGNFDEFSGLLITDTVDELDDRNLALFVIKNSNKETLMNSLETIGPVAVLVKSGWKRNGANHMAILSGYDPEADVVTIYDPNLDKPLRLYWATFDSIWKINFTGRKENPLMRTFFIIVSRDPAKLAARQ